MMFNVFRVAADFTHAISILILIFTIHRRRSAEGISLLTQLFYTLVFLTRYLDLLFWWDIGYNTIFKLYYIGSSLYILFLMVKVYARTREEEKEWKVAAIILGASAIAAPIMKGIFGGAGDWFLETLRTFSLILEAFAVIPQITLLRHTQIPTAITSYYLLALGLYRALYIPNWIIRLTDSNDGFFDPNAFIFGVIQTALYIDFAWIYYRRQRVKIRENGAILDGEDFISGGLILGWLMGKKGGPVAGRTTGGGWRGGGLSVSADDEVMVRDSDSGDELEDELQDESEEDLEVEGLGSQRN
ncbi:uncharacterized protein LAJ45_04092 [Morchella importuna]|nr:uncharacterized protein LAJ45_04092 [Morchella importuna]KAH8152098.1 hypothetical protein LAJ45_04092 [Morchella importuna]